jgi:3-isopropylmalate/(R)-2-methylmalate dehydratase small subunit
MTLGPIAGRVAWIFEEDDFDVDQIVGVRNIKLTDVEELAALAMRDLEPDFRSKVQAGDVLVGGRNFGYGHPHYPPLSAMRHLGISALIAESFAPAFWRGEISMGFPLVSCPGILAAVSRWDRLAVDWDGGVVVNQATGARLPFLPLGAADRMTLEQGGLIGYLKHRLAVAP